MPEARPRPGRRRCIAALAAMAAGAALARTAPRREPSIPEPPEPARLPVLAERIAKLHIQAAQAVLAERSRKALPEAVREFDAQLRAAAGGGGPEAREAHTLLRLLWQEYRGWALKTPTRENARNVAERADEVAWVGSKLARLLEATAPTRPAARQAYRACVLTQRVPRLHLMRRWAPRDGALARQLEAESLELRRALQALAAQADRADVVAELQVAENQHVFLERAARELAEGGPAAAALEVIVKTGDHILDSLQRVVRIYRAPGG